MNIQIKISTSNNNEPIRDLRRIPHDVERVNVDAGDMRYRPNVGLRGRGVVREVIRRAGVARPEIYRCSPDHTTRIAEKHQFLWRNINPEISNTRWRTLLGNALAWTNQSGFPGRADYVNRMELDKNLPNFHATLVNGGMIVEGEEDGNKFWLKSLLIGNPILSADELLQTHMWSYGTSVIPRDGSISIITRLGTDGTYKKVRIPFLTARRVWLPVDELHKLQPGEMPDPYWMFEK